MELISIAPGLADHPGVKHFSWDDIGQFADQDRAAGEFDNFKSGDWKRSSQGGDGYRLVSVGGLPYWGDAVGQIPFAVDTYRMYRRQGDTHHEAAEKTRADGLAYHDGSKILGTLRSWNPFWTPSDINNYDNAIIARTTAWAQFRWTYQALPRGGPYRETNTGYGYEGLAYR
jgi:hypothetical protein